jgi:hypothetical protein
VKGDPLVRILAVRRLRNRTETTTQSDAAFIARTDTLVSGHQRKTGSNIVTNTGGNDTNGAALHEELAN